MQQVLINQNQLKKKLIQQAENLKLINQILINQNKVPTDLNCLKSKADKLDVHKLVPVPVDFSKLSDVVKNDVVKKDIYNAKIKNIEYKIPDIINLAIYTTLNAKINEVQNEINGITTITTTSALNAKK